MKKVLLTALSVILTSAVFGQRSVDWTVDQVIKPTSLKTNMDGSTTLAIEAVFKNLGTDSVAVGDSVYVQWLLVSGQTVIISYPSASTIAFYKVADKVYKTGDTMQYARSFNLNLGVTNSGNITFVMNSEVRKSSLSESKIDNNAKASNIIWYNRWNNGVSVRTLENSNVSVFPNPSNGFITVSLPVVTKDASTTVTITDVTGKAVLVENFEFVENLNMNVSALNNGIYILNVKNGDLSYQTKITIAK